MKRSLACILTCSSLALPAHAEVWKCVDTDGHVTYTNNKANTKGCQPLTVDLPVSTVPAAKPAPRAPATTPQTFPRVDSDTQKSRDDSRKRILEDELAKEEQALQQARQALSEGEAVRLGDERNYQKYLDRIQRLKDTVSLHERNVEALKRELANLNRTPRTN